MGATLRMAISQGSQDIVNNKTYVSVTVYVDSNAGSWNGVTSECKVTVSGTFSDSWYKAFSANTTTTLGTTGAWVAHNPDGTKTVSFSVSYTTGVSPGTIRTSGSKTLTPINRKSGISISPTSIDADGDSEVTVTIDKKNSSFTDVVTVTLGDEVQTFDLGSSTKTQTFSIPLSWNNQMPDVNSAIATVMTTTKNRTTVLGSSSASLTVNVPQTEEFNPTVTPEIIDANGYASTFGKYLVGLSQIKVTGLESGKYGAAIKSRKIEMNGSTYTSNPAISTALSSTANTSIVYSVTDTRGRTASLTSSIQTYAYTPPKITENITPIRWSSDTISGTPKNNGDYAKVGFTFTIDTNLPGNSAQVSKITSKTSDDSVENVIETTSGATKIISANHTKTVAITYYVQDSVGRVAQMSYTLPTAEAVLSSRQGYQFAIGKVAEKGTSMNPVFEVGWKTFLHKDIDFNGDAYFYKDIFIEDAELEALLAELG